MPWGRSRFKYGAKRVQHEGRSFASQLERALYDHLKVREKLGEIKDIECQKHVYLTDAEIGYIPDFVFTKVETNEKIYCEAKGFETSDWRIKYRLWQFYGPGPLEIWKGTAAKLKLKEMVIPKTRKL